MPAFIPWILSALLGGLRFVAGSLALQVLVGLGIGVVTYTGMDISLNYLKQQAVSNLSGLPADMLALLGYMKVGNFINIVTSAMVARMSMTMIRNAAGALAVKRFFKL
jgi:Na+-transporting NADH:ubiquinone oxidoreductase subunit NqrE